MRWQGRRGSGNVVDRRGMGGLALGGGGGLTLLIVVIIYSLLGGDPRPLLNQLPQQSNATSEQPVDPNDQQAQFVAVVLADTEDVWNQLFQQMGETYQEPKLVLFNGGVQSACGFANSAVGPFYCPGDQNVYLDLGFFRELSSKYGAPGDFAQAYVIAHEVGHHVQNQMGVMEQLQAARGRVSQEEFNRLSVRVELQADYFAGVWAHHANKAELLEADDIDEALNAATAIGDDTLQKQGQGYVVPDSFTHGTSEQRVRWFRKGFESGNPKGGDTFSADEL